MVTVHKRDRTFTFTTRRRLGAGNAFSIPTECDHRKKPHGERVVGPQTTRSSCSDGHRRHRRRCPSEHCGHPGTWLKVLELVNHWSRQLSGMPLSSPGHGMAHSSRKVSLQPYTVTDANALSENERSRFTLDLYLAHGLLDDRRVGLHFCVFTATRF